MRTPYHDIWIAPSDTPTRWDVFRRVGKEFDDWLWQHVRALHQQAVEMALRNNCSTADLMRCLMAPQWWPPALRPTVQTIRRLLVENNEWLDEGSVVDPAPLVALWRPTIQRQALEWRTALEVVASHHVRGLRTYDPTASLLDPRRAIRRILIGLDVMFRYYPAWFGSRAGILLAYRVAVPQKLSS